MTETVSGTSTRGARKKGGLKIERVFSTEGVHPYDELTWERRDVVQQNWKTGAVVFEQRGVEFPDTWSVNASTIVTTKYFRGAVGTDAREWSLKQLIDRVVKTYTKAGDENGYFATDADAELFEHELTWLLVHQYFSFNSPVWFNVGTASPQQVSACFILVGRRLDGLDPELVQGRGLHLQGRLRRRPQPLPHPLLQGAALQRRYGERPGLLHARRRRLRGHHQVRWRHASRGEDGRPGRRPPRHRRVRRDQGQGREQDPRPARRRLRHGPRRRRHHVACSTRTPTTRSACPTSSCAPSRTAPTSGCARAAPARSSRPSTPASCSPRSARPPGPAPTRVCSTTTRSTTGTPTRRRAGSPRPTRARNTCRSTTRAATSRR